jgi:hypothetical protein
VEKKKIINDKILSVLAVFSIATAVLIMAANKMMGSYTSIHRYLVKPTYGSSGDLFYTLINKPNRLFAWCCDCIRYYAIQMGITYEQLNIHLFVIIQPMLIILFLVLFIIQSMRLNKIND